MPDPLLSPEDASLYVLDLLEPEARRAFEAELENSLALRRHVAELETNLAALALAAPPAQPPPHLWAAIAQRTTPAPAPAPAWAFLRGWLLSGWAAATLVAAAFALHLLRERPATHERALVGIAAGSASRNSSPESGDSLGSRSLDPGPTSKPSQPGATTHPQPLAGQPARGQEPTQENARLQDRVRRLSEQVALLTRVLTQQSVLPSGASRLQVFRLISTNGALDEITDGSVLDSRRLAANPSSNPNPQLPAAGVPTSSGSPGVGTGASLPAADPLSDPGTALASTAPDMALSLALAAARELATLPDPVTVSRRASLDTETALGFAAPAPSAPALSDPIDAGAPAPVETREPIRLVDLSVGGAAGAGASTLVQTPETGVLSGTTGSAFGAYSPDTGQGAVAFRVPADTGTPGVFQLWISDAQTGVVRSLGFTPIGTTQTTAQVMVMRFTVDRGGFTTPTFMITQEPAGGSPVPTGPVVAIPPTGSPSPKP